METPEEQSTIDAKDYTYIVKGKRTKRQKVHSPVPFAIPTGEITPVNGVAYSNTSTISPTSSDELRDSTTTEEEEDMANCLILLAQGHRFGKPMKQVVEGDQNDDVVVQPQEQQKFNSRKFLEKAGYYVYQCKTCNKTFPSFQALGGHRASHKKPNSSNNPNKSTAVVVVEEERINNRQLVFEEEEGDETRFKKISSLSPQLSSEKIGNGFLGSVQHNRQVAKIHECSICGAEFTSGQALGGHMRRHRAVQVVGTGTALALTAVSLEASEEPPRTKSILSLDLDLNLPAPEDEPFDATGKQHQQQHQQHQNHLVFSTPALVDCHY